MNDDNILKKGTQIIYVPQHVDMAEVKAHAESLYHAQLMGIAGPDIEYGFVAEDTHTRNSHVFCRYWSKHSPRFLRTRGNSESTPADRLLQFDCVPQNIVTAWLTIIEFERDPSVR